MPTFTRNHGTSSEFAVVMVIGLVRGTASVLCTSRLYDSAGSCGCGLGVGVGACVVMQSSHLFSTPAYRVYTTVYSSYRQVRWAHQSGSRRSKVNSVFVFAPPACYMYRVRFPHIIFFPTPRAHAKMEARQREPSFLE